MRPPFSRLFKTVVETVGHALFCLPVASGDCAPSQAEPMQNLRAVGPGRCTPPELMGAYKLVCRESTLSSLDRH